MPRVPQLGPFHGIVRTIAWAVGLAAAAGGCAGGTETGNPSFEAKLSYTTYSTKPTDVGVREPASVATVASVWLVLDDVQFIESGSCAGGTPQARVAPGLGVGNHASGKATTTDFALDDAAYCAVELPLVLPDGGALPPDAPASLSTSSLVIEGTLADSTPFTIQSRTTASFRLVADGGTFAMNAGMPGSLIGFDVATWVGSIDWAAAAVASGRIDISPTANTGLLTTFESGLARGITLYRDRDGDGQLDAALVRLAHSP